MCISKSISKDLNSFDIDSPTIWAVFSPLLKAKIEGPDPEIPLPKAPFCIAASFKFLKPGINADL